MYVVYSCDAERFPGTTMSQQKKSYYTVHVHVHDIKGKYTHLVAILRLTMPNNELRHSMYRRAGILMGCNFREIFAVGLGKFTFRGF